ncbi:MAG: hypothetical protein JRJ25_10155 [Deltaproteobacteria bacterium]|nr:hypothetical protein [Deltaproteobacteria bacterium]
MRFKKVIIGAIDCFAEYKLALFKALLIPMLILIALDTIVTMEIAAGYAAIISILAILVHVVMTILTHRIILLGPDSIPEWGFKKWTMRATCFTLYSIVYIVPVFFASVPYIGIIAVGVWCYIAGRLSLVFPAIAIDDDVSFKQSWNLTKKYNLLMFLVVVIAPALLGLSASLIGKVPFGAMPYTYVFASIYTSFGIIFIVILLSVTYRLIKQEACES